MFILSATQRSDSAVIIFQVTNLCAVVSAHLYIRSLAAAVAAAGGGSASTAYSIIRNRDGNNSTIVRILPLGVTSRRIPAPMSDLHLKQRGKFTSRSDDETRTPLGAQTKWQTGLRQLVKRRRYFNWRNMLKAEDRDKIYLYRPRSTIIQGPEHA